MHSHRLMSHSLTILFLYREAVKTRFSGPGWPNAEKQAWAKSAQTSGGPNANKRNGGPHWGPPLLLLACGPRQFDCLLATCFFSICRTFCFLSAVGLYYIKGQPQPRIHVKGHPSYVATHGVKVSPGACPLTDN